MGTNVDVSPAMEALSQCLGQTPIPDEKPIESFGEDIPPAVLAEGKPDTPTGVLQPIAARVLMKVLYGARMARYDLLRAVCNLASCVTKWTEQQDKDLYRFICYINSTLEFEQVGWIGDNADKLMLRAWADADFAGDPRIQRSTSGVALALVGPSTRFFP